MTWSKVIRRFSVDTSTAGRLSYAVVTSQRSLRSLLRIGIAFALIFPALGRVEWRAQAAPAAVCPVRIMPLGDSITTGKYSGNDPSPGADADDIGYRKKLKELLTNSGYSTDFVGSMNNGQGFTDTQHEGHNGITDAEVAKEIYNDIDNSGGQNWLGLNPPDIILLHIGTNSLSDDPNQVEDILDEIDEYESDSGRTVVVILARIIKRVPPTSLESLTTIQFNNNVQNMVQARIDNGDQIVIVNMEVGAGIVYAYYDPDGGDMWDYLHPYATGYDKMATVWKAALDNHIPEICANQKPDISPIAPQNTAEGVTIVPLQVSATDPNSDPMTFDATGLPPGLDISPTGPTTAEVSGTISYDASTGSQVNFNVVVTVNDDKPGEPSPMPFTWTVNNTNRAPTFSNPPGNQSDAEGEVVSVQFTATDPDGNTLTYTQTGLPPGLGINATTGLVSGTIADTAYTGDVYPVQITATDNGSPNLDATTNLTWTVSNTNQKPEFINPPVDQIDAEGDEITLQFTAQDPDGDTLTFSADGLPPGLSISPSSPTSALINGTISYVASEGSLVNFNVIVTVNDDKPGEPSEGIFTWTVTNTNRSPEFINPPGDRNNDEGDDITLPFTAEDPDGDALDYTSIGLPLGLSLNPAQALIAGTLANGSAGTYTVILTVSDGLGGEDVHEFVWTVTPQVTPEIFITYLPLAVEQSP